ncbi:helix-turn-helix domain-containing protein [Prevotella histicola]|uniref:helix-turn-helix domain-containing protein n=1 Tax=Prevotella histicola TaxID=470565 RepID=UPI001C5FCA8F|nr:helix-turn-helix transcriptional regulator [Prevotella histicola]
MDKYAERKNIGKLICQAREEKNISLEQLSEITGLSSIHLSRIEEGRLNIGIDMLSQILNGLDVKITLI